MRNIKLTLEYDGSHFFGFQKQPGHRTIHGELERALSSFFNQKMKIASASGRTDTGVHAAGQVVNFKTASTRSLWQIQKGLNALLPDPVGVTKVEEVSGDFHARFRAKSKTYEYLIWNDRARSPLRAGKVFHVPFELDFKKMKQAAKILTGKHDFLSFCATGSKIRENTVRTVKRFDLVKEGSLLRFRVEADGFLYHMVRNMVGTLIEVGCGRFDLKDLRKILQAKDRKRAGRTAPACGLTLLRVTYDE